MAHVISISTPHFAPVTALRAIFAAAVVKRQRNHIYRTTRNELMALSDRHLNDLGLSRSGIAGVALEAANNLVH